MYSKPFYITSPVGNNAFSFDERRNKKLYVPSLIKAKTEDIKIWNKIAFEDFNFDSKLESCIWLENFYEIIWSSKKIYLFDNHNHAFYFWHKALINWEIWKNNYLFHIDEHSDMRDPWKYLNREDSLDLEKVFQFTNYKLNVGNYIIPAIKSWLIKEVIQIRSESDLIWITSSLDRPIPWIPICHSELDSESLVSTNIFFKKDPESSSGWHKIIQKSEKNNIILNLDLDFFRPELDFIDYNLKKKVVLEIAKKATVITVASSPFFIEQKLALKTFKDLFT